MRVASIKLMYLRLRVIPFVTACFALLGCSLQSDSTSGLQAQTQDTRKSRFGVLLMAHGGSSEWNAAVTSVASDIDGFMPIEIAFGMADAGSIERAAQRLEDRGVTHAGVVRLFVSGDSWLERTLMIFGLKEGAPSKEEWAAEKAKHTEMSMPMGFWNIQSPIRFSLSQEGLANSEEMDIVIRDRIASLSKNPHKETVMVIAHGTGDDEENFEWIRLISERTKLAKSELDMDQIKVFSLREDWMGKRAESEFEIRAFLQEAQKSGNEVIVIPFRVQGFGPYQKILADLTYNSDSLGLLPHPAVGNWIRNQASILESFLLGGAI